MNLDVSSYLKNMIPDYSSDVNPLEAIKKSSPRMIRNVLSNILKDISQISVVKSSDQADSLNKLVNSIIRLDTIIRACGCIEDTVGRDIDGFDEFKTKVFIKYKDCFENLGIKDVERMNYNGQISDIMNIANLHLQKLDLNAKDEDGMTPLNLACEEGNLDKVKLLCSLGASITETNWEGMTPLDTAIYNGFHAALEELLKLEEARKIINAGDRDGDTPLHFAVTIDKDANEEELQASLEDVKLLIKHGARVNMYNKASETPLHIAIRKDFHAAIEELLKLEEAREIINARDKDDDTPLHLAVTIDEDANEEELQAALNDVKLLIKHGAKVNIYNKKDETPLHVAIGRDFHSAIEELLKLEEARKIINARDEDGDTPLHIALRINEDANEEQVQAALNNVKLLIKHGAKVNIYNEKDKTPLHIAIGRDFHSAIKELLKLDESREIINARDEDGDTPLHSAVTIDEDADEEQLLEALNNIKLLIKHGAKVNIYNKKDETPLHVAAGRGFHAALEELLKLDESREIINARDEDGDTPLISALENGLIECAQLLIDNGADVTIANNDGTTPFHIICEKGYSDLIKILLDKGADPNACDKNGSSPIYKSIIYGNENCTEALIKVGVPITDVPNRNKNSIFSALLRNSEKSLYLMLAESFLQQNDVNIRRQDGFGNTPLHYICMHGSSSLLELFVKKIQPRDYLEKNIYYETPLQLAFDKELWEKSPGHMERFLKLFQNDLKIPMKLFSFRKFTGEDLLESEYVFNEEYLKIALLLNDYALAQKIKAKFSEKEFEEHLNAISLKFGPTSEEFCKLQNFYYNIDKSHLQKGLIKIPEEKAEGVEIKDLLKMFDALYDQYPGEITPENFRGKPKEYLREILEGFIEKVEKRKSYTGTPDEPEALEKFYKTIEIAQTHIIKKLESLEDPKRQVEILKKLIEEVHLCGGKIYTISEQFYREVCREESQNFESQLYHRLANLREMNFTAQIPSGPQSVHDSNILMHELGLECGIPGGEAAKEFEDEYVGEGVDVDRARNGFFKRYNSYAIANFIQEQCKDSDFLDLCLDWIVENIDIPSNWNQAWDELIQNKGNISEASTLEVLQKKILKTLLDINSGDINWEDLNDLEASKSDTFKGSQRISIDPEIMVLLLKKCGVFCVANEEA